MIGDLISRQDAIDAFTCKGSVFTYGANECKTIVSRIMTLPSVQLGYTKADYIMALHKEYGCTLTKAEEAHNKALEFLRNEAMMKG